MRRAPLIILLTLLALPSAARADPAAPLFDTGSVAAVDITLPDSSRTALNGDPGTYQPATLSVKAGGSTYGPFDVTLKLKGHASFRDLDHKAAFKIKLAKGKPLLGLKKLTLNNMVQDPAMVREALAYETFRAAGVPAPRTGYAFVRVNDQPYGVYLNLETLDDVSLKGMFPTTGHLYENGFATDLRGDDWKWFEVDEGDEDDRSDLQALTAAAQAPGDFSDRMAGRADLAEMVSMWATEKYVGQWDGYAGEDRTWTPNNFYLHSRADGVFSMLPWGTDQTFVDHVDFDQGGTLFRQCRQDPSCEAAFRQALARVTRAATALDLPSEARRLAKVIAPYQAQDPRKESTQKEIDWWFQVALDYMAERPYDVATLLGDPSLAPPRTPARGTPQGSPGPRPGPVSPAATPIRRPQARLRVGRSRRRGAVISTPVRLPFAGVVRQRMTMTVRGRRVTVCAVTSRRMKAGRHTLRCRLTRTARGRLRHRSLRISQTTRVPGLAPVRTKAVLVRCSGC